MEHSIFGLIKKRREIAGQHEPALKAADALKADRDAMIDRALVLCGYRYRMITGMLNNSGWHVNYESVERIIRSAVMLYIRFPLSLRNVEDLLHERGIDISHETVRFWWSSFGPLFAAEIRKKRVIRMRAYSNWQWRLDEVFVKINGETHYLWRAVDHESDRVLIEDAATGKPLFQECRQTYRSRFILFRPEKNKEIRFNLACAPVEAGNVLLPREAPWLSEFNRVLQGFPRSRQDDQVDSSSQFLNWSKGKGFWNSLPHDDLLRVRRRRERINKPRMPR
jgi:predicted phage terminase large subunit-like protein